MRFSQIQGLSEVKKKLIGTVGRSQIAHAQLFVGAEGSANLSLALAYASYLNCTNRSENDSCGECPSCLKADKLIHPDIHFSFPVSSTKNITGKDVISANYMTEWRKFATSSAYGNVTDWSVQFGGENKQVNISKEESRQIIKSLALKAFEGGYKIMIIWLPEYMNQAAANSILKILEEPPENTVFILVSNQREKLLTTILSRTQLVNIPSFVDEEVQEFLVKTQDVSGEIAHKAAYLAEGNLGQAIKLLGQESETDTSEIFREWMRECYKRNYGELVNLADVFQKLSKELQKSLMQYTINMTRETLIWQYSSYELTRLNDTEQEFVSNFSKVITPEKVDPISHELSKAYYHLERNANPKILFLDLSLTLSKIIRS